MTEHTDRDESLVVEYGTTARVVYTWEHHEDCPARYDEFAPCLGERCRYRSTAEILRGHDALGDPQWHEAVKRSDLAFFVAAVRNAETPPVSLPPFEEREAAVVAYQQQREYDRVAAAEDAVGVMATIEVGQ